jgi:hypothetical protein
VTMADVFLQSKRSQLVCSPSGSLECLRFEELSRTAAQRLMETKVIAQEFEWYTRGSQTSSWVCAFIAALSCNWK